MFFDITVFQKPYHGLKLIFPLKHKCALSEELEELKEPEQQLSKHVHSKKNNERI